MPRSGPTRLFRFAFSLALLLLFMAPTFADEVDTFVRAKLAEQKLPGAVFSVMRHGEILRSGAYGFANLELGVPATTATVFQIGSITKQFAARAVLMLADQGKLRLDDPISLYLSRTPENWERVTLYHLLTHTSGIPNWIGMENFSFLEDYSEREFVDLISEKPLDFAPGDHFQYSSAAYSLLSVVIEKVTEMRFGEFLESRIFGPAGMESTHINDSTSLVANRAQGYVIRNGVTQNAVNLRPRITAPSGAVLSTISDLARYERVLLRGDGLKPSSRALLLQPVKLKNGQSFHYGLGWYLRNAESPEVAYHTGTTAAGFRAAYFRHLPSGISVVFLCNVSGDGVEPLPIAEGLARIYLDRLIDVSQ